MKVGVLIPTRGDRPELLKQCLRLVSQQTLFPSEIIQVDFPPTSEEKDITKRYREGYSYFRGRNCDVIAFIEDDDYYSPDYLETMVNEWVKVGKPDLFGTSYTWYYHIGRFEYFKMRHTQRSSAMSTLIKPDLNFPWCPDHEPYTDTHLWMASGLQGKIFTPSKDICLGIKHGTGLTGGNMHTSRLHRYLEHGQKDVDKAFLKSVVDPESFEFYCNYSKAEVSPH